jgi:HD superfamily phosphohydrolase
MEKKFKTFEELIALAPQSARDELERLKTYEEDSKWHPEANVYEHIKIVTDRLITTGDIDLIIAGLYHDLGKLLAAEKTLEKTGKFRAFGHEHIGAKFVKRDSEFIESMGADVNTVESIVSNHMRMKVLKDMSKQKVDVMKALPTFSKLEIFTKADSMLTEFKL